MSALAKLRKRVNSLLIHTGFQIERSNVYLPFSYQVPRKLLNYNAQKLTNDFLLRFAPLCDVLVDIGCNRGVFSDHFDAISPRKPMYLVEPIPTLARDLRHKYAGRSLVKVVESAVSNSGGSADFFITANDGQSSSLLKLGKRHLKASPDAVEVESISVKVNTIDEMFKDESFSGAFLKIDVQGHELTAFQGASKVLERTLAIHIEVSTQSLYNGDAIGHEVWSFLESKGFQLYGIDPWFRDRNANGELLQADFFFIKKTLAIKLA
jgi:FkbM family methyltransferase